MGNGIEFEKIWIVEAHEKGALRARPIRDAVEINRRLWRERKAAGLQAADRMVVGVADGPAAALELEKELKREKGA